MLWYVCDVDKGVLRIEPSRCAAVEWWKSDQGTDKVIERFTYGPGHYGYLVSDDRDDAAEAGIVREDKLPQSGITTPPSQIQPLYPFKNQPHEALEALACS